MNKWVLCTLALTPAASFAQFDFGGGSSAPAGSAWSTFKLPKTKIKLDFRNASIDSILAFFSKSSGIAIVKDPALTGNLSLTSPTSVSIDDAFELLSVTLDLKNFELKKQGKALVVRAKQAGRGGGGSFGASGMTAEQIASMSQAFSGSNTDLKVYPLKNANAAQVARVINEVFASSQSPLDQFIQQMAGGGATGGFGGNTGGGGRTGGGNNPFSFGGRQGGGGRTGGGGFGGRGGGTSQQSIKASSDDYSNSVIVNAPKSDQNKVEDLIKQLDKETEQPLRPLVYKLEYASANDLAVAVQNVLTTNAPRGRGGQGQQGQNIGQQFQQAFRLGSAQAAFGTVVADVRTNSLIVTATEENHVLVKAVLKELDSPIELQSSTFVVQLANARADQVATLLNQTFGGRTTNTGAANGVGRGANATGRTNNQNNAGGGGGGGQNAGGGRSVPTQQELEEGAMNLDNIDPDTGEFYPLVAVQQGGGFGQLFGQGGGQRQGGGFGGGQNRNQTTQQATGRDANGKLVNLRDLSGQVTVIPDQNTNSLIIVTSPDNVQLIQNILNQLDRIPEQVMIETIIVEATLDASDKFGVEWKLIQNNIFGTQGKTGTGESTFGNANANPALQGFKYTIAGGNLTGFLNAMATDKKFQVLSTPRIFTSNNSQAQINISQRVPYVLSSRTDANGNLTYTYGFEDVGIVLTVTPRITSNGYVTMEVNQTANDLQGFTDFNAPIINQREADTTVSVLDGETVILGGIIRSSVTSTVKKIPLLGDIPILGNLFKSSEKSKSKTELLVFLSPRIVKNSDEAQKLKDEEQKKLSPQTKKSVEGLTVPKPRSAETKPPEMKKKEDSKKPK